MLGKTIEDALNQQIRNEMYSSNLYLAMAAHCESVQLPGFAHWLRVQSREEMGHALALFDYIVDRGGRARVLGIDQPPADYETPLSIFEQVLEHEKKVTAAIHDLYEKALAEKDYATQVRLQEFIQEQVEEERTADTIVAQLKAIGGSTGSLFYIDRHMGKREG